MARITIKGRVISVVQKWYRPGKESARPTTKHLAGLWTRNKELEYGNDAKADLVRLLDKEFKNFKLGLKPSSFGSIKSVQNLVDYIERL